MVQLNLLPDVKLEYMKTKKTKRMVLGVSLIIIAASVGLFVLMFSFVNVAQKGHIGRLNKDTDKIVSDIQNTEAINEILTVQNQLNNVDDKHIEKPQATRILDYINNPEDPIFTPGTVITNIDISFVDNTIRVEGTTVDSKNTNQIVDSFKFATYKAIQKSDPNIVANGKPFLDVVLSDYTIVKNLSTFEITMKFDPIIFNNTQNVSVDVPDQESTRSSTEKPRIEFGQPIKEEGEQNGQ